MSGYSVAPRIKPLSARKSAILCVLDVGTSKVACLIARLVPIEASDVLRGRTHRCRILGIGHQRSRGMKGGAVVDMDEAEQAIRHAVDAAERMAGVQAESVIVNITGGRLTSHRYSASIPIGGVSVGEYEIHRVLEAAASRTAVEGRMVLHSLPTSFSVDDTSQISDPKDMIGEELSASMHVVSSDIAAARNLMLAVERCHLDVEAMVATPYAAGLAALVDDEADLGTTVIDLGGGTTSMAVFAGGRMVHIDAVAVGGNHVTMDIARGLTMRLADSERLKTYYGSCIPSPSDEREVIAVTHVGEDADHPTHMPKSQLVRIIKPRVEEILELVRDRLAAAGFAGQAGHGVVLTGGASQLTGLPELARRLMPGQIRLGRPLGVQGLPASADNPAFSAAVGMLVYPQVSGIEHFEPRVRGLMQMTGTDGYIGNVVNWLRKNF
ncbi:MULTISPECIES: cell division protein FtsA [unclassified Beijerinckia]|uniref:cell division protein FtsA n=1 Tax=unclassified Beijerinckia TaxID=2638183 RepID=UPI000897A268|nr:MULTISPECIES: cell division protein FtsA [unclassified Beijerinckia]MDH7799602.1 cell division protein FtsA [Beijerinckia sp. GAS462]SEB47577.1 cell division protein FtsA [Beijerinckia sp. 28-YEA-48]